MLQRFSISSIVIGTVNGPSSQSKMTLFSFNSIYLLYSKALSAKLEIILNIIFFFKPSLEAISYVCVRQMKAYLIFLTLTTLTGILE